MFFDLCQAFRSQVEHPRLALGIGSLRSDLLHYSADSSRYLIYGAVWLSGLGGFYDPVFVKRLVESFGLGSLPPWAAIVLYFLFTATFAVIRGTATVLGEEIGWRGFLVPEFAKTHSFLTTAVVTGLIWSRFGTTRDPLRGL